MAFELWKELESSPLILDAFAMKTGINAAVGHGQYDAARQLLSKLKVNGQLDSTAYNMLLKGFADCGRFKEAREVLDEMILSEVVSFVSSTRPLHPVLVLASQTGTKNRCACCVRLNQMPGPSALWRMHMCGEGTSQVHGRCSAWLWMQLLQATLSPPTQPF
jgi:pentatricopeptide repeat protein